MKQRTFSALALSIGLITGCASGPGDTVHSGTAADSVFVDGQVYTVNEQQPWAQAVAVKGGEIVFVGSSDEAKKLIGQHTQVTDLDGKMVLPGFIDTHAHPIMAAGMSGALELNYQDGEQVWLEQLADYVADNPHMDAYLGFGFYAATMDALPTKEALDNIVADKPVIIMDAGGHSAWVNSKALELGGIDKNTPDPIPGSHFYQRNDDGSPTGYCLESQTFFPLIKAVKAVTTQGMMAGSEELFWLMNSAGITTVYDAGMMGFEDMGYEAYKKLEASDNLPLRVVGSYMVQNPKQIPHAISRLKSLKENYSSELVRPSVIKIHNDGTKEAYTAAMFEDYHNQPGNKGSTLLDQATLTQLVKDINKAGIDIHIHAIGDKAVHEALNAFESARLDNLAHKPRFSMAHNELILDKDLSRFAKIDVVAQTTPFWFSGGDGQFELEAVGKERAEKLYRFKAVQDAGARLTFGSDFPASEGMGGLFPAYNIEMGMTRQAPGESDSRRAKPVNALLTLETMIKGYTLNAAYQLNMETEIGSIEVGKKADLVVLQDNLFEVDVYDIHGVRVDSSYVNGKQVYKRNWQTWLAELVLDI